MTRLFLLSVMVLPFIQAFLSLEKCRRETNLIWARNISIWMGEPPNITCTFLNDTYCAVFVRNQILGEKLLCFLAKGRIVLFQSTAECTSALDNKTTTYSIYNDPWCIASNCSWYQAGELYNLNDRYEDLGINSDECKKYTVLAVWPTTLSGMCAWETESTQRHLPEVTATEVCKNDTCVMNYTSSAELHHRECHRWGGVAFRQPERRWTCQASNGINVIQTIEVNVPHCVSNECPENAMAEEEEFLNQKWAESIQIPDGMQCSFQYASWEELNLTQIFPILESGNSRSFMRMRQWTALCAILAVLVAMAAVV